MYLGFFVGWFGLWIVFGQAPLNSLWMLLGAVAVARLLVLVYEEPTLRRTFGTEYEEYCRNVPGWIPRLSKWEN